jgi:hypothetical protein
LFCFHTWVRNTSIATSVQLWLYALQTTSWRDSKHVPFRVRFQQKSFKEAATPKAETSK